MQLAVISQSARLYAHFAHAAGLYPAVVDAFLDADTRSMTDKCFQCDALLNGWNTQTLHALIDRLDAWDVDTLVIGSGFEHALGEYQVLYQRYTVAGNSPQVVQAAKDPFWLANICDELDIASPTVEKTPPTSGRWLIKQQGGCGGGHVHDWQSGMAVPQDAYFQAWQPGLTVGGLFVANGSSCRLIGVHQCHQATGSYHYAGATRYFDTQLEEAMQVLAERLMTRMPLQGMFSIDACWHAGTLYLLEINPRVSASMRLYAGLPLMQAHLAGCLHQPLPVFDVPVHCASHRVLYAKQSVDPRHLEMPEWVEDRPAGGVVEAGQPLCSLYAQGENKFEVQQQLLQQQEFLKKQWGTYVSNRIQFFND